MVAEMIFQVHIENSTIQYITFSKTEFSNFLHPIHISGRIRSVTLEFYNGIWD